MSKVDPLGHSDRRRYHLSKRYGISAADYDRMLEQQGGVCAICGGEPDRAMGGGPPRLVVDHNHSTGKVRALLCFSCNVKLSAVEDEQFLLIARAYLREHGFDFIDDTPKQEQLS